ncbi:MAG TPA: hypothetical protein VGH99_19465 [Pseudonocardia sp.]
MVAGGPLTGYEWTRDRLSRPLLAVAEQVAGYRWTLAEVRDLPRAESAAMRPEVTPLRGLDARPRPGAYPTSDAA